MTTERSTDATSAAQPAHPLADANRAGVYRDPVPLTVRAPLPAPGDWSDPLSGIPGPRYFERILAAEKSRLERYDRTASVALVAFDGFDRAPTWMDRNFLMGLFARLARAAVEEVRTSDHAARLEGARIGILLVETDEVLAINVVDRIRAACIRQLDEVRSYFGVRVGWASPGAGQTLDDALRIAEERLAADRA